MANVNLSFRDNACRISLKVAGGEVTGSGFIYITAPKTRYNYVITARHTFQEGDAEYDANRISNLKISYYNEDRSLETLDTPDLRKDIQVFSDIDLCILKVNKVHIPNARRILVKNIEDVPNDLLVEITTFPKVSQKERLPMDLVIKDPQFGACYPTEAGRIKDIKNYVGISGSAACSKEAPCLVSIIEKYSHTDFENEQLTLVDVNWHKVNKQLKDIGWEPLKEAVDKYTSISDDNELINIGEINVKGVRLDFDSASRKLSYDLRDDWFFDPLHYVDMCNRKFILEYFSINKHRKEYSPCEMEVCYIPKKTCILRKAMVGNFIDRLVYTAIADTLGPLIESHLDRNVFSARYDLRQDAPSLIVNGVEQWIKMNYQILYWLEEKKGVLVKVDLLNYFDTINKEILVRHLREVADNDNEAETINLLEDFLQRIAPENHPVGIPQNSDASSLFATFYMSHVDEIMNNECQRYCRFMDDIYFVAVDIFSARAILQDLEKELRDLDLALNAAKVMFVDLSKEKEKKDFAKSLYTFDFERQSAVKLLRSHQKAKRMNGVSVLVDDIHSLLSKKKLNEDDERGLTFCLKMLSSYDIHLDSYWHDFYDDLLILVERQIHDPARTPLLCRIIAALDPERDIKAIEESIAQHLIAGHFTYEWQTYNIWLLMAYKKYGDTRLFQYAVSKIERNDETRRVEIAAVIIYVVTIRPEYARVLLHRLRNGQIHGYLQQRAVLVACRRLGSEAFDEDTVKDLPECLRYCFKHLHAYKDKPLVFFHNLSSYRLEQSGGSLFPEFYSGL